MYFVLLFQPSTQFRNLSESRRHKLEKTTKIAGETGRYVKGLCYDDNKMYCVEYGWKAFGGGVFDWLTVYDIRESEDGNLNLLDNVNLMRGNVLYVPCPRPCVDSLHRVYVPCGPPGIKVFHYQDGRLLPAREPLRCVKSVSIICPNTSDTVFVYDENTRSIYLVSVSTDTVIRKLQEPAHEWDSPHNMSVLGQTLIVQYHDYDRSLDTLVTYHSDRLTLTQVLQTPEGLPRVKSITTDRDSSSILVVAGHFVFAVDDKFLWHRIYRHANTLRDCAVVQSQLWLVDYESNEIVVLSSQ